MKVIDCSPDKDKEGASRLWDNWKRTLQVGGSWTEEVKAQDDVITYLHKVLNNRYFVLRNVILEGLDVPIPLTLVGPMGVVVVYTSPTRGVFRAKGDLWEILDPRRRVYKEVRPNLIKRVGLMARVIDKYLQKFGYKLPAIEPVLVFTDPGTHIELVNPQVRIVLVDALDRFVAGLLRSPVVMDSEDVQNVVDTLNINASEIDGEDILAIERDDFDFIDDDEFRRRATVPAIDATRFDKISPAVEKMPFSYRQWLLLGLLLVINIIVLLVLAWVLFISV
jgi:hypothetical protein